MDRESLLTCGELQRGDVVQAKSGHVLFTGRVIEIHVGHELFWAVDSLGDRRLIDLGSYEVYQLHPPST